MRTRRKCSIDTSVNSIEVKIGINAMNLCKVWYVGNNNIWSSCRILMSFTCNTRKKEMPYCHYWVMRFTYRSSPIELLKWRLQAFIANSKAVWILENNIFMRSRLGHIVQKRHRQATKEYFYSGTENRHIEIGKSSCFSSMGLWGWTTRN